MLIGCALLLLSCGSLVGQGLNIQPPQYRWSSHAGLLNVALRGSYLPPPGQSPNAQRPSSLYLPPPGVAPSTQRPPSLYIPPPSTQHHLQQHQRQPSSHHPPPVTSAATTTVVHSQPSVDSQPWIPIVTAGRSPSNVAGPPGPGRVTSGPGSGQDRQPAQQVTLFYPPAPQSARQTAPQPAPQSARQTAPQPVPQSARQTAPQPAPRLVIQPGPELVPQIASQSVSQPAAQRSPQSFLQPAPQSAPPPVPQPSSQSFPQPVSQPALRPSPQSFPQPAPQPAPQSVIQPAPHQAPQPQSFPNLIPQPSPHSVPHPVPQTAHQPSSQPAPRPAVQEVRISSGPVVQETSSSSGQHLPLPVPLDFQYLPPSQSKISAGNETLDSGTGAKTIPATTNPELKSVDLNSGPDGLLIPGSNGPTSSTSPTPGLRVVIPNPEERQRPLVVYFEGMHFRNKATEQGFCQSICASPSQVIEVKAGKCPPIRPGTYRGDCQDLCKYDSECPKQQRCCNVGCANVCLDPVFRKTCNDFDFQCPEGYACIDDPAKVKDAYCVNTTNKAGRCPAPQLWDPKTRSCEQECSYDFQCQADERCCFNGCAKVCVAPDLRKRCEDHNCEEGYACVDDGVTDAKCISTAPRDGRCPRWSPGQFRECGEDQCQYDGQCPDGEKCCNNGCANVCVKADTRKLCSDISCPSGTACVEDPLGDAQCFDTAEKAGLCPRISNDTQPRGGCQDTCKFDSQCDGDSKCCFNGCAYVCLRPRKPDCEQIKCKVGYKCSEDRAGNPTCSPIPCKQDGEIIDIECNSCTCIQGYLLCSQEECPPVKPGFCPKITKGYKGKCVEDCDSDYNCADEHKCCSTGCGHTCQKPVSEIVHPCKTVRFRCGDATRCAATRGLCQPGKTCPLSPLCVSTRAPFCESCPPGKVCVLQKRSCPNGGNCHRQPICIQLYSDDTIFEEDEELEQVVVAKQTGRKTG